MRVSFSSLKKFVQPATALAVVTVGFLALASPILYSLASGRKADQIIEQREFTISALEERHVQAKTENIRLKALMGAGQREVIETPEVAAQHLGEQCQVIERAFQNAGAEIAGECRISSLELNSDAVPVSASLSAEAAVQNLFDAVGALSEMPLAVTRIEIGSGAADETNNAGHLEIQFQEIASKREEAS